MGQRGKTRLGTALAAIAGWACVLVSSSAGAGNGVKPRVPPTFLGGSCIETVDRGASSTWVSGIGIPYEDAELTEDEPEDSRRFQFFAVCRPPQPLELLPKWISQSDADRAQELADYDLMVTDEQVLETSENWGGPGHDGTDGSCFLPITADEARMPITCDATAQGVEWDLAGVPGGNYVVYGYTWEPELNKWTPRPGVVRIVDEGEEPQPAVAFSYPAGSEVMTALEVGVTLEGCVAAAGGSTLTLRWAVASDVANPDVEAQWNDYSTIDVDGPTFEIPFEPPEEVRYKGVFFRLTVEEPGGATWDAFTQYIVIFLDGCDAPQGGEAIATDECGVGGDPVVDGVGGKPATECDPASETGSTGGDTGQSAGQSTGADTGSADTGDDVETATTGTAATDTDMGPEADPGSGGGCGCTGGGGKPPAGLWLALLSLGLWRRRTVRQNHERPRSLRMLGAPKRGNAAA